MKVFCVVLIVVAAAGESLAHESHEAEYAPLYAHPSYSFSYGVKDSHSGDVKSQWETRDNGVIKGHYSVVEPDGSIREVDYTADSKNGFNAVVKTHGPNEHPIVDEHGHTKYGGKHAQSKINHYSKDQDTLILSSDVPINEPGVAEINEKTRHNPSILELKPNVHLGAPPQGHGHGHGHGNSHSYSQSHSHSQSHTPSHGHSYSEQSNQSYQPLKFRPQAEIKEHQPSYMTHHSGQSGSSSFTSQGDVIVGTHSGGFKPSPQVTKPKTVIKLKKQEVKKVKLITPGLKHYANVPKFVARNDYNNYFRSRSAMEEQRDASHRLVQGLYRRSPRTLLVPQYAPDALNYHF